MENSEIQKRAINLGKGIVNELSLDPGVDTLSRWMAHYIAEQIAITEHSKGEAKARAEKRCFKTILALWQRRAYFPRGHRPFQNFEAIFRTLERLDPENPKPLFFSLSDSQSSDQDNSIKNSDEIQGWLEVALGIDRTARIWIDYIFRQASIKATDEKTIKWLENSVGSTARDDISIIVSLVGLETDKENKETSKQKQQAKEEEIKSRIEKLDAFNKFNKILRKIYISELNTLAKNNLSE